MPDRIFVAHKMRMLFRATEEDSLASQLMKLISVPLTVLRDYTVPIAEEEQWDRQRASVVPMTTVFAFLWLNGNMKQEEGSVFKNPAFVCGLVWVLPGAAIGYMIR